MHVIQTTAIVTKDGQLHVSAPPNLASGEHRVVVIVEDSVQTKPNLRDAQAIDDSWPMPVHNPGPWPEGFTVSREEIYGDWGR